MPQVFISQEREATFDMIFLIIVKITKAKTRMDPLLYNGW